MGLFSVKMPLLYGEKERVFHRLQEEIMETTENQSLFALVDPGLGQDRLTGLHSLVATSLGDAGITCGSHDAIIFCGRTSWTMDELPTAYIALSAFAFQQL
jgi:hypothetical protein